MFGTLFQSVVGPIGIDFGAHGVKMLQLRRRRGRLSVVGAARVELPTEDAPPQDLAEGMRAGLASGGFVGRQCVVGVARNDLHLQSVRIPNLPDAELAQTVIWEAADRFHQNRDELQVDFVRLGAVEGGSEARDEVLIVAATCDRLHERLEPLMAAGLRPIAMEPGFLALVRCHSLTCRRETDRSEVRGMLEIGASGSIMLILHGDQLALCKPISIGGAHLDQAVAEHLAIDPSVAGELRTKRILNRLHETDGERATDNEGTERAMFEAVRTTTDRIVKEVGLCMRYYGVTFRGHPPERLILAGGDGLEPHLAETLATACKLPVVFDDPASPVADLFREIEETAGTKGEPPQCWAVAAGLSLRELTAAGTKQLDHAGKAAA